MSTRIALVGLLSLATRVASLGTSDHDNLIIDYLVNNTCSRSTRNDDVISVHYRGTLQSDPNLVFDESFSRGSPITFILGKHQVITGWDLGLLDMCVGDERMLTIPPSMAYGARAMPKIPASSTLVFGTKLMSIKGVPIESPLPSVTSVTSAPHTNSTTDRDSEVKAGECRLLGPFALVVQSLLGALALLSLVIKRWRERPQRPLPVWFFDASKQVVGTALLHVFNIAMSIFSGGQPSGVSVASKATLVAELAKYTAPPNPCSFYLLNLAIDTTLGIPILVIFLRVIYAICLRTPLATPPESIKSGHYGSPPHVRWWAKQCLIYFMGLLCMKLFVFFLFAALPWLAWVGDWALRWTEGNESLQIAFVMFIFPLAMNMLQYYIIDGFIKDDQAADGYEGVAQSDQSSLTDSQGSDSEGIATGNDGQNAPLQKDVHVA